LSTKLKERLNLVKANTFSELVNMALTQEDYITAHRAEKKQRISTGPASVQPSRYRFVQNALPRAPQRNALLAGWFSGCLHNKEGIDLPYPRNSHNNLAHGRMFNKSNREAALIAVSIAGVWITSSEIVRSLGNLIKGKVPIRVTRIRARGQ
jgi:hypothetical protein